MVYLDAFNAMSITARSSSSGLPIAAQSATIGPIETDLLPTDLHSAKSQGDAEYEEDAMWIKSDAARALARTWPQRHIVRHAVSHAQEL